MTATKPKLGGDGVHNTFHPPFSKPGKLFILYISLGVNFPSTVVAAVVWGTFALGFIIPVYSVRFQNKKHGFSK